MIEIKHLVKSFDDLSTPLKNVNATINKGDVVAIVGHSGNGKSTLLRCINRLEEPTSGQIIIDGEDITKPKCDISLVRRKIGMVFQSFNLYEHLTAVENVMLAQTLLLGKSKQEAYDKAMQLLDKVGLKRHALKYPNELSGGQAQRVAIARALSTDPEIILFDEPTSALDPRMVGEVQSVIAQLAMQGNTMIIVTHDMRFAKRIANRVFFISDGIIYEEGTPKQIFNNPQKEKTRQFVQNLSTIEYKFTMKTFDQHKIKSDIHNFNAKIGLDPDFSEKIEAAFEQFVVFNINDFRVLKPTIHVKIEYNEKKDKIYVTIDHNIEKKDFDLEESEISMNIINDVADKVSIKEYKGKSKVYTGSVEIVIPGGEE